MPRRRHTDEQIIAILREGDAGAPLGELCRRHGISSKTCHRWKAQYGGLQVDEARRLRRAA
ncbi:MAG: transposase [Planctomycetes bacterium]|nr:transposase [Planctomycetota bacterium]